MSDELEHIWSRVQVELSRAVGEPAFRIWLEPLCPRELADGHLVVEAPPQVCRWIHDRFGRILEDSVALVLGPATVVELAPGQPGEDRDGPPRMRDPSVSGASPPRASHPQRAARPQRASGDQRSGEDLVSPAGQANPKLTFEQFVIGGCNQLAHAAALAVAEMPAHAYNPLFICGPPGVGKTHLLNSIARLLLSHSPELAVRSTTGEAFTNEFLTALTGGHTEGFKERFRHIDVLLLDDVQFLERKTKTEEEFFHTFNALHDAGRQVVLTSDRPPNDLQALEDRLRERFQAGLVADIKPPDLTTRIAILRKRVQHDHIEIDDELVLEVIAERIRSNVRALEGALIRVVAFSSLTRRPLTGELAHEVLNSLGVADASSGLRSHHSITAIQAAACQHFGVSSQELLSSARTARIAWPRQVAMYLARELTGESLPTIGRQFGGRDHTTVLHAWRRAAAKISDDDAARQAVEKLCATLTDDHR